jgi:hypothetical protein
MQPGHPDDRRQYRPPQIVGHDHAAKRSRRIGQRTAILQVVLHQRNARILAEGTRGLPDIAIDSGDAEPVSPAEPDMPSATAGDVEHSVPLSDTTDVSLHPH